MAMLTRRAPLLPDPLALSRRLGRMLVSKKPARSEMHRVIVRTQPCLACCAIGGRPGWPMRPHHARGLFERTFGVRISDYHCVPLCRSHHHELHLGFGDEEAFWAHYGLTPLNWLAWFLGKRYPAGSNEEADEALQVVRERIAFFAARDAEGITAIAAQPSIGSEGPSP